MVASIIALILAAAFCFCAVAVNWNRDKYYERSNVCDTGRDAEERICS